MRIYKYRITFIDDINSEIVEAIKYAYNSDSGFFDFYDGLMVCYSCNSINVKSINVKSIDVIDD